MLIPRYPECDAHQDFAYIWANPDVKQCPQSEGSRIFIRVRQDCTTYTNYNPLHASTAWTLSCATIRIAGDIGHYYYGPGHPMKPIRLKLAHHLVLSYGMYRKLQVYVSFDVAD